MVLEKRGWGGTITTRSTVVVRLGKSPQRTSSSPFFLTNVAYHRTCVLVLSQLSFLCLSVLSGTDCPNSVKRMTWVDILTTLEKKKSANIIVGIRVWSRGAHWTLGLDVLGGSIDPKMYELLLNNETNGWTTADLLAPFVYRTNISKETREGETS